MAPFKKRFVEPELIKYEERLDEVTMGPCNSHACDWGGYWTGW